MLSEPEKRAAALAVSRYGADRARVHETVQAVLKSRAQGQGLDLVELLLKQALLTLSQAQEIRALDATLVDPNAAGARPNGNGKPRVAPPVDDDDDLRTLGDYRILRRLGTGGMGAVYLGYEQGQDRHVAIKVLPGTLATNQVLIDRFQREAKSGALLNHPNIVRNITAGQDKATGKHYLVLEYVDGPSAQALVDRFGRLEIGDAVHIVLDVARALEHAHSRNIVHRDIKPANILITQAGIAKLADLGLAKRTDETSHLTATRQTFGTPYYMPYEQAMNARSADARSDIYALGATLYHLLTGEMPFPGVSHVEIVDKKNAGHYAPASTWNAAIPAALDNILAKMLAREPRDRYQTASELIVELERANLAVAVPSFVDPERAMQDPLVRQRLTEPAQPTCLDVRLPLREAPAESAPAPADIWYVRYRDRHERWCKAKATTAEVLERLRTGKLAKDATASRTPQGEFLALADLSDFRDALAAAAEAKARKKPEPAPQETVLPDSEFGAERHWALLALSVGGIILLLAVVVFLLVAM